MDNSTEFHTTDLYLAAYLKYSGLNFLGVVKAKNQMTGRTPRSEFIFEDRTDREVLCQDFYNYKALVEPKKLLISLKDVKTVMYEQ